MGGLAMEQRALKRHFLNINIYSYLDTHGGQSYNLYLNVQCFNTSAAQLDICDNFSCIGV